MTAGPPPVAPALVTRGRVLRFLAAARVWLPVASGPASDNWMLPIASAIAASVLGYVLLISQCEYSRHAVIWLAVSLSVLTAAFLRPLSAIERKGPRLLTAVLCMGVGLELLVFLAGQRVTFRLTSWPEARGVFSFLIFMAVGMALFNFPRRAWFPLLAVSHFIYGAHIIWYDKIPLYDVLVFQRDGCAALLQGVNPYAITFPDVYGPDSPFTIPGTSVNGRITFGYNYPPINLLMALPAALAGVPLQLAQLTASTLAAVLIAYTRPVRAAALAAALLMLMPRTITVVTLSWTEPFMLVLFAGAVYFACRRRAAAQYFFALFLVTKQHLVMVLPALVLVARQWFRGRAIRHTAFAILLATVVNLPFLLWNPPAFVRSLLIIMTDRRFRMDSISFLAWLAHEGGPQLPSVVGLVAVALGSVVIVRRAPRTSAGLAVSVAFLSFVFFAFNIVGFCNYYYFVIGALCCGIAAAAPQPGGTGDEQETNENHQR